MIEITGKYTTAVVHAPIIESTTHGQISNIVNHPAFVNQVRIMPDTHAGASNEAMPLLTGAALRWLSRIVSAPDDQEEAVSMPDAL